MTDSRNAASRPPSENARRVLEALHRSARRAREKAAQTGTEIVIVRGGELVIEAVGRSDE
jgi:hypothetical protein